MAPPQWQFITRTRSGQNLADLSTFLSGRTIKLALNRPPQVTGSLNLSGPRADVSQGLAPGVHELLVMRNNAPVGGLLKLSKASPSLGRVTKTLDLSWDGIETYLAGLTIPAGTTENVAQSQHAWNRISAALAKTGASVYGLIRGAIPATDPVKQRTYSDEVDVLTAIQDLSARANGFDFDFDTNRAFNAYYPYKGQSTGLVFEYGKNVLELSYDIDASAGSIATDVLVKGSSATATSTSSAAQAAYGHVDVVKAMPDQTDTSTVLQTYADAALTVLQAPVFVPTITIDTTHPDNPWGSYNLGDTVTVRAKAGTYVNITGQYRIVGITITLADTGTESIALELNQTLPMLLNRAVVQAKQDAAANANNSIVSPTLAERVAALERNLT